MNPTRRKPRVATRERELCLTTCIDKIYTQRGRLGHPAKFQTQTRFVLRSGDDRKGRTCTFQNGTLELQDGLNLTRDICIENSLRELETMAGRTCVKGSACGAGAGGQSKVWG